MAPMGFALVALNSGRGRIPRDPSPAQPGVNFSLTSRDARSGVTTFLCPRGIDARRRMSPE